MTSTSVWDDETASRYDHDVADRFAPEVLEPTVSFLRERAGAGRTLEFAVGTGRVAIPLVESGLDVTGVDLSPAMVAQLRRKVAPERLPVVVGDMTSTLVPGEFTLVYLVFNSLSNLQTQAAQVACFQNAARHLAPGGRFVVEMWIPPLRRMPPGQVAVPFDISANHIGLDTYDLAAQRCVSHHWWHEPDGSYRRTTETFRYAWPAELDLMAQLAGCGLEERVADWRGGEFTSASENQISVWRK